MATLDGNTVASLAPKQIEASLAANPQDDVSHETSRSQIAALGEDLQKEVLEQIEISFQYEGYISKQREEIARLATQEGVALPADFDYMALEALSIEVRQ